MNNISKQRVRSHIRIKTEVTLPLSYYQNSQPQSTSKGSCQRPMLKKDNSRQINSFHIKISISRSKTLKQRSHDNFSTAKPTEQLSRQNTQKKLVRVHSSTKIKRKEGSTINGYYKEKSDYPNVDKILRTIKKKRVQQQKEMKIRTYLEEQNKKYIGNLQNPKQIKKIQYKYRSSFNIKMADGQNQLRLKKVTHQQFLKFLRIKRAQIRQKKNIVDPKPKQQPQLQSQSIPPRQIPSNGIEYIFKRSETHTQGKIKSKTHEEFALFLKSKKQLIEYMNTFIEKLQVVGEDQEKQYIVKQSMPRPNIKHQELTKFIQEKKHEIKIMQLRLKMIFFLRSSRNYYYDQESTQLFPLKFKSFKNEEEEEENQLQRERQANQYQCFQEFLNLKKRNTVMRNPNSHNGMI